jgi:hypothetical protein
MLSCAAVLTSCQEIQYPSCAFIVSTLHERSYKFNQMQQMWLFKELIPLIGLLLLDMGIWRHHTNLECPIQVIYHFSWNYNFRCRNVVVVSVKVPQQNLHSFHVSLFILCTAVVTESAPLAHGCVCVWAFFVFQRCIVIWYLIRGIQTRAQKIHCLRSRSKGCLSNTWTKNNNYSKTKHGKKWRCK